MKYSLLVFGCCSQVVWATRRLLIPAYFYPGTLWDDMEAATDGIAIMNPYNGPGDSLDANYLSAVQNAQQAGLMVVGYVYTSYASRDVDEVRADVDSYLSYYSVDGIFFDETTYSADYLSYYANISDYVYSKGSNMHVTLNPGMYPDEAYLDVANLTVVFEGSYAKYATGFDVPSWAQSMEETRMAHLVYDASESDMSNAYNISCVTYAGYAYITNDDLNNPWDTLPSYWDEEIITFAGECGYDVQTYKKNSAVTTKVTNSCWIVTAIFATLLYIYSASY